MLTKRLPNTIFTTVRAVVARHIIEPSLALPSTIVREMSAADVGEDDLGFFIWATCRPDEPRKSEDGNYDWKTISIPASMHSTIKEARTRKSRLRIVYRNSAQVSEVNTLQII